MRIGVNLLYLLPGVVGGTETYARSLLRELVGLDPANEFVLFVNRESRDVDIVSGPNVTVVHCPVSARRRGVRYAYEQAVLPVQVARAHLDVLHSPGYVGPVLHGCPHVVTVHDLIYVGFKEYMGTKRRVALRVFVRASARRAQRVITVSNNSRAQILDDMGLSPEKVVTIPLASRDVDRDASNDAAVLERYRIERPYAIAFGSLSPSKNIDRLVEAAAEAMSATDWRLVVVGHVAGNGAVASTIARLGIAGKVILTGYVPDEHVLPLMANAGLFVFPSLYEGFGLPVLDAQAMGVPVASSHAASLPEVAGAGAVFFDPRSVDEMARALRRCILDEPTRERLITAGRANAAKYSWENVARQTLRVYEEVRR